MPALLTGTDWPFGPKGATATKSCHTAGPEKKYPPLTGFDLLSKTGNAYEARKNDPKKEWQKQAYLVCSPPQALSASSNVDQHSNIEASLSCTSEMQDAYSHEAKAAAEKGTTAPTVKVT